MKNECVGSGGLQAVVIYFSWFSGSSDLDPLQPCAVETQFYIFGVALDKLQFLIHSGDILEAFGHILHIFDVFFQSFSFSKKRKGMRGRVWAGMTPLNKRIRVWRLRTLVWAGLINLSVSALPEHTLSSARELKTTGKQRRLAAWWHPVTGGRRITKQT